MAARVSEAFVLRTYPFREADLLVSFFTRDQGKLRGTARGARKPKNLFGSGLERLSLVRMHYSQRETRELVTLIQCDLAQSQFGLAGEYEAALALDFIAEVSEALLPPDQPEEKFFRLLGAVTDYLRAEPTHGLWPTVLYFSFWAVQLSGFLPELRVREDSLELAAEMARTPIAQLAPREWTKHTASDMRRVLIRQVEEHIEQKLKTVHLLEAL